MTNSVLPAPTALNRNVVTAGAPGGYDIGSAAPAGLGGISPAGFGGGDIMGMIGGQDGGQMMSMIPQLMQLANIGGGHRKHRRRR